MSQILNSIKELITPEFVDKVSSFLGEDKANVTSAISSSVPALLSSLLSKGDSPDIESLLINAGKKKGEGIAKIDEDSGEFGSQFINLVLGDKFTGFTSSISSTSGISMMSASKLLTSLSSLVTSFLGNKLSTDGISLSDLLGQLSLEKRGFQNLIPAELTNLIDVPAVSRFSSSEYSEYEDEYDEDDEDEYNDEVRVIAWMKWLFFPLILIAILLGWKYCHANKLKTADKALASVDDVVRPTQIVVEEDETYVEFKLPNGIKIQAFEGGIEDQLIKYISSPEFKKASQEDLKKKWFNFDNVKFQHASSTVPTDESYTQLNNILEILKLNRSLKVKIGGYTDKAGDSIANIQISQDRANAIKAFLDRNGVGRQIVATEGYGSRFAVYPATASEAERALDRKIALRLEK